MAKTPPSLKWLIDKRIRLAGKVLDAGKRSGALHADLELLRSEMEEAIHRLQAVDTTMGLHEIQIEPTELKTIRPRRNTALLPYGQLSRILLSQLRRRNDWVSTHDLAISVVDHLTETGQPTDFVYVMFVVRNRLNGMCRRGSVIRHLKLDERGHLDIVSSRLWSLPGREAPRAPAIYQKERNRRA